MIPAIVHRIWLGSPPRREHEVVWQRWQELFEGYELRTWLDDDIAALGMPPHFHSGLTWAERSDIARLRIINTFGGIYTDCDVTPLARFDFLWNDSDRIVVFEERPNFISNSLFAAAPRALSFTERYVRRNAGKFAPTVSPVGRTGPYAFTTGIQYELSLNPRGLRIYPHALLDTDGGQEHPVASTRFSTEWWAQADGPAPPDTGRDIAFEARFLALRLARRVKRALVPM